MRFLILAILIFSQTALGTSCPKPVTYLTEGTPASCTGYLFSPVQELEVRTMSENYKTLEEINGKQEEMIQVMDMRLALQTNINKNLREQNDSLSEQNNLTKILWFGIGVFATATAWYLTQRK